MRILVVEDEVHNSRMLIDMIKTMRPGWEIVKAIESVADTVLWLKHNEQPDLIFMDIQLSDGICFNIFDMIDVTSMVIFTTAYDKYAIQSFKVHSVDYLLKPIKDKELLLAIGKFERIYQQINSTSRADEYKQLVQVIRNAGNPYRKRFMVSGGAGFLKLEVGDVAYFETEDHATFAHTFDKKQHLIDSTLEKLEQELDPDVFFKCNRGIVVNIDAVSKVEPAFGGKLNVELNSVLHKTVKISRLKAMAFKSWIDK